MPRVGMLSLWKISLEGRFSGTFKGYWTLTTTVPHYSYTNNGQYRTQAYSLLMHYPVNYPAAIKMLFIRKVNSSNHSIVTWKIIPDKQIPLAATVAFKMVTVLEQGYYLLFATFTKKLLPEWRLTHFLSPISPNAQECSIGIYGRVTSAFI